MLGLLLLVLALVFGSSASMILALVPLPVLGALLCLVGVQHALLARDVRSPVGFVVVFATAAGALASGNVAVGFGAGIALDQAGRLPDRYRWLRGRFGSRAAIAPQAATARLVP
jgi:hypothetical protein